MRNTQLLALILSILATVAPFGAAHAQGSFDIDYVGFAWEDGGIPPSNPGDVLAFTAVATDIDPAFGVDLNDEEVTLYVYGLVSTGEFVSGSTTFIGYTEGFIEVYSDPSQDHDWGVFPPNAQQGTFTNGDLMFDGEFTDFTMAFDGTGAGAFEGNIDGVGGTVAETCTGCAFTFGGAFGRDIAQIPDGYDLQIDGVLQVDDSVPNESTSFGAVKALYQR